MPVGHAFTSAVANETAAGRVRPLEWNAGHVVNVDLTTEVTGVLPVANGGANGSTYITTNGSSTTTASIPFALGWSSAGDLSIDKATPTFTWKFSGITSATISSSISNFSITGASDTSNINGVNVALTGGNAFAGNEGNGGFTRLKGGTGDISGDILGLSGFTTTGTSVSSFSLANNIGGLITSGNGVDDFAVGGNFYAAASATFANGIGLNGKLAIVGYMALGSGDTAQTLGLDRNSASAGGVSFTVQSGWAKSGSTNLNGGDLILAPGKATGTGTGSVQIQAVGGAGSGNTDSSPTTVATWGKTSTTFADPYDIVLGTTTGTKIGTSSTQKLGFFGVTPVVQQANSVSLETVLSNMGLRVSGSAAPITVGTFSSTSTTDSTTTATGGGKFSGGVGIAKNLTANTAVFSGGSTTKAPVSITASAGPTSPGNGNIWNDATQNMIAFYNGNILYQAGNLYTATAGTTINSTSPATCFSATAIGTTTIAANSLKVGQKFAIWGAGYYSTPLANTSTVTITVKIGSVTVSTVTTAAFPASATNLPFDFLLQFTVQAVGSGTSAKIVCDGTFNYATALSAVAKTSNSLSTIGQIGFDSTAGNALDVQASWSAVTTQAAVIQQAKIDFL